MSEQPGYEDIVVTVQEPVAVIRLNRPETLNAFTYHTLGEIRRAMEAAVDDPAVVGIVVTGTGRGFCSGLDARTLADITADRGQERQAGAAAASDELPGLFSYFLTLPKPIIAAVNGVAAGGGLVLAAASDVRFASTNASFTTAFLRRGLIAEHGTSWLLPRLLGTGRALDLLWTSRRIDAEEAYHIGLVEYLCEPDALVESAGNYVRELAESAAPLAMADSKRLVYRHFGTGFEEAYRETDRAQWQAVARPDADEGARALLERRAPRFERLGRRDGG